MIKFENLRQLVATLNDAEKDTCIRHLKALDSATGGKALELFNRLIGEPAANSKQVSQQLFGKRPGNAFLRLQQRLYERILDVLANEPALQSGDYSSALLRTRLLLQRQLNHAHVLIARRMVRAAEPLLMDIGIAAGRWELFDEQLAALHLKEELYRSQNDELQAGNTGRDMLWCRQRIMAITTARQLTALSKLPNRRDLDERLWTLQEFAKEAPSITCTFLLAGIEARQQQAKANYKAAEQLFLRQAGLATENVALKDRVILGEVYVELAANAVHHGQLENALGYLLDAEHALKGNESWQSQILRVRFHALFYLERYANALKLLKQELRDHRSEVRVYWMAACHFMLGHYVDTVELLRQQSFLLLEAKGCGYCPFFLLQMAMIEVGVRKKDKGLKKKLMRLRASLPLTGVSERELVVNEVLGELVKHGFDFEAVRVSWCERLLKLQDEQGPLVFSGELIKLEKWVDNRLEIKFDSH